MKENVITINADITYIIEGDLEKKDKKEVAELIKEKLGAEDVVVKKLRHFITGNEE